MIFHTEIGKSLPLIHYDLYVFAGQSNQIGGNTGPNISSDNGEPWLSQFSRGIANPFYDAGNYGDIIQAENLLQHQIGIGENQTVGSAIPFCKLVRSELGITRRFLILAAARGATGFGTNEWNIGNTMYDRMVSEIQHLVSQGAVFKYFSWRQGENDISLGATTYRAKMVTMHNDLRARFGDDFVFHMATMTPVWVGADSGKLAIQGVLQDTSIGVNVISTTLTSTDVGAGADTVHWTANGQRANAIELADDYVTHITT